MNRGETEELLKALDERASKTIKTSLTRRGLVLFSGGIDSCILATLISRFADPSDNWQRYTLGLEGSSDVSRAELELPIDLPFSKLQLVVKRVDEGRILEAARKVLELLSFSSFSQFEDSVAFYLICDELQNQKTKGFALFTANGPDELFCGYNRFRRIVDKDGYGSANAEILRALQSAKLLQERVRLISERFGVSILEPFFDPDFVSFCMEKIPIELKIQKGNDLLRKRIWRDYGRFIGLPEVIAARPKKAMQYSMGIHRPILSAIKRGELQFQKQSLRP